MIYLLKTCLSDFIRARVPILFYWYAYLDASIYKFFYWNQKCIRLIQSYNRIQQYNKEFVGTVFRQTYLKYLTLTNMNFEFLRIEAIIMNAMCRSQNDIYQRIK